VTAPKFETLLVRAEGAVGRLTLNRPERLNALGATMMRELVEAARYFDTRSEVRAVIVSGAGRSFSAGADLRDSPVADASTRSGNSWAVRREVGQLGLRMADAVESMRAVTVAQIHGYAVGGGVVLAAACDLRVAASDAVFSIPEIELGIPLAWGGIPRLVREIGPALTKELVMTCRPFTADEAQAAGFLNRVVPADQLDDEVDALASLLVTKSSLALRATKRHVDAVTAQMVGTARSWSDADSLVSALHDPESREAAGRYLERLSRRSPPRES
jgi:enoyl-CoA hydratase/carnithine racemase